MLVQITEADARKLFRQGADIVLCPSNFDPDLSDKARTISGAEWNEIAGPKRRWSEAWNLMHEGWLSVFGSDDSDVHPLYYLQK